MRGEHRHSRKPRKAQAGSSPHARGALRIPIVVMLPPRIIPACAGSTNNCHKGNQCRRDHPRMRGEHTQLWAFGCVFIGSSPHARGAPARPTRLIVTVRIIPACAGSTSIVGIYTKDGSDHPRMRGEHNAVLTAHIFGEGSSPHARGAPRQARGRQA